VFAAHLPLSVNAREEEGSAQQLAEDSHPQVDCNGRLFADLQAADRYAWITTPARNAAEKLTVTREESMRAAAFATAMTLALGLGVAGQAKPNFAGRWTLVSSGPAVSSLGRAFTVEYTEKTLVVSPAQPAPEGSKTTFNLDGSPLRTVVSVGAQSKQEYEIVRQLEWEGSTLVLGRTVALKGQQATEYGYRWSLDEKGYLSAESLSQWQSAGRNATTPKAVYQKN